MHLNAKGKFSERKLAGLVQNVSLQEPKKRESDRYSMPGLLSEEFGWVADAWPGRRGGNLMASR